MELFTIQPVFANALSYAFEKATPEGKVTIGALLILSLFSWTVIITKARQLWRASIMSKKFFGAYRATRDPLEIFRKKAEYDGSPAYEVYATGAAELAYHLKNNPVEVKHRSKVVSVAGDGVAGVQTDVLAKSIETKISGSSFETVRVALERAVSAEGLALEKSMIVLSTAVAGGPFIGLLGTVWGVMETFSGIGIAKAATLTAMAPGVAGALIATVVGLFVAIPAMFAYNFMVTRVRAFTQELDNFATEYATAAEHTYVDHRPLAEEITEVLKKMNSKEAFESPLELETGR